MKLKKIHLLVVSDSLAFVCFTCLISTGIIMHFLLPPGSGRWLSIWQLNRHDWGNIHFWLAMGFLAVIAFHLLLHRRWIDAVVAGKNQLGSHRRWSLGLLAIVVLIVVAFSPIASFLVTA